MIHLDTSFLARALVVDTDEDVMLRGWVRGGESLGVSTAAWAEFLCGPVSEEGVEATAAIVGRPEPLNAEEAHLAARLFNESGRRRGSLVDCMIAATAMQHDAGLATSNLADFRRLAPLGLRLLSPA